MGTKRILYFLQKSHLFFPKRPLFAWAVTSDSYPGKRKKERKKQFARMKFFTPESLGYRVAKMHEMP